MLLCFPDSFRSCGASGAAWGLDDGRQGVMYSVQSHPRLTHRKEAVGISPPLADYFNSVFCMGTFAAFWALGHPRQL